MKTNLIMGILLFSVGCGQATRTASNPNGASAGIINGQDVTIADNYSQHVVFLQLEMGEGTASCTGTIRDNQTILTAAHCLVGASRGLVVFANKASDESVTEDFVRDIDKVAIYPKFQPPVESGGQDSSGEEAAPPGPDEIPTVAEVVEGLDKANRVDYDVALVHFQGGLPAGYAPVELATDPAILSRGAVLQMIGYGLSEVTPTDKLINGKTFKVPVARHETVGQLRETSAPIDSYSEKVRMIYTDSRTTGVCSGDSGGPGFMTDSSGKIVQVGIAEAVASSYCNSVSIHTAVFPYLDWIKKTTKALANPSGNLLMSDASN